MRQMLSVQNQTRMQVEVGSLSATLSVTNKRYLHFKADSGWYLLYKNVSSCVDYVFGYRQALERHAVLQHSMQCIQELWTELIQPHSPDQHAKAVTSMLGSKSTKQEPVSSVQIV